MIDEKTLPIYIQKDIKNFLKAKKNNDLSVSDWWCELYGSINSAEHNYEISEEVAWYLRKKYLEIDRNDL